MKHWGGTQPTLTHAAWVLAEKYATEFNQAFGPHGRDLLKSLLMAKRFSGTEDDLKQILSQSDDVAVFARQLRAKIEADLEANPPSSARSEPRPTREARPPAPVSRPEAPTPAPEPAAPAESPAETEAKPEEEAKPAEEARPETEAESKPETTVVGDTKKAEAAEAAEEDAKKEASEPKQEEQAEEDDGALSDRTKKYIHRVWPAEEEDKLRAGEATDIAAQLLRDDAVITAIVGERGAGRTTILGQVAARLASLPNPLPMWRMGPDTITTSAQGALNTALSDITGPGVLVVDDLDVLARLSTDHANRDLLTAIGEARYHEHARLILVIDQRYFSRLPVITQTLADTLEVVSVRTLPPEETSRIVRERATRLAQRLDLELSEEAVEAALTPPIAADGIVHPGLGIGRLDLACARAYVEGALIVDVEHLGAGSDSSPMRTETANLATVLKERVKGQDEAIERVARRLTLTRAHLDLRPDRPNGVFLFIGPTGVGKTQLAKEIAAAEFGNQDRLIRLDMSEYYHESDISRIAGPPPGYVGSTEPESWLTTKVAAMPRCVVLLDEIEKAHPRVWNVFLQVFDAGRLTDGRGVTADFSETVMIMTSNLGLQEARSRTIGFGEDLTAHVDEDRLMAVVKERMAPELLNRVDEIVVFNTLTPKAIEQIAINELATVRQRLNASGWQVTWTPEVTRWLAETGYDPAFGARHLHRNIEKELLILLAEAPTKMLHVDVLDNRLAVLSAEGVESDNTPAASTKAADSRLSPVTADDETTTPPPAPAPAADAAPTAGAEGTAEEEPGEPTPEG
jgi:MoxR-like ATPase